MKKKIDETLDIFDGDVLSADPYSDSMKKWLTNEEDTEDDTES